MPPPPRWGGMEMVLATSRKTHQIKNPETPPRSPLALAGAVVVAPAAGLVEMDVLMCLGVVLVCLAFLGRSHNTHHWSAYYNEGPTASSDCACLQAIIPAKKRKREGMSDRLPYFVTCCAPTSLISYGSGKRRAETKRPFSRNVRTKRLGSTKTKPGGKKQGDEQKESWHWAQRQLPSLVQGNSLEA